MRALNANINGAAALSATTAGVAAAALGLFTVGTRLVATLGTRRRVNRALDKRLARLRLNLGQNLSNGVLGQGTGQYRHLWRRYLHGYILEAMATSGLSQEHDKGSVNQRNLNDLVGNLVGKRVLPQPYYNGGYGIWLI
jgi:hypothetical protein